jgi:Spy/CpxP family protein refolding chaperone
MATQFKINPFLIYFVCAMVLGIIATPIAPTLANAPRVKSVSQIQKSSQPSGQDPLNLTQKQKEQIFVIQKNANKQMLAVLTPDQKVILQKSVQSKQSPELVQNSLKLTKEQDLKIESIQSQASKQILALLTPAQLQSLKSQANNQDK